jgi:hypothetical protein
LQNVAGSCRKLLVLRSNCRTIAVRGICRQPSFGAACLFELLTAKDEHVLGVDPFNELDAAWEGLA